MTEKVYKYWLFFIKPKYKEDIYVCNDSSKKATLFAYTNKKKNANGFLLFHSRDAFIIKEEKLTREGVNLLAKRYQNNIIRPYKLFTRDNECNTYDIIAYMTEKEYMQAEGRCYSEMEDIYKYVWNPIGLYKEKYRDALITLDYLYYSRLLDFGKTEIVPPRFEADIYGSFIEIFKSILEE